MQLINLNANRITLESAKYLKTFLHNYSNVGIQNNMSKTYSSKQLILEIIKQRMHGHIYDQFKNQIK